MAMLATAVVLIAGAVFATSHVVRGAAANKGIATLTAQLAAERAAAAAAGAYHAEVVRLSALSVLVERAKGVALSAVLASEGDCIVFTRTLRAKPSHNLTRRPPPYICCASKASAAAAASASELASASVATRDEMDAAHKQIELTQTELKAAQVARASANHNINALSEQLRRSHAAVESIKALKQGEVDAAVARAQRSEEESAAFVTALSDASLREDANVSKAAAAAAAEAAAVERQTSLSELTCPITCDVFADPVVAADGSSYERAAIEDWLARGNTTSPMTNAPLAHTHLTPNKTLRAHVMRLAAGDGAAAKANRGGGGAAEGGGGGAADPLLLSDG